MIYVRCGSISLLKNLKMVELHWKLIIPSTLTCRVESNTYVKSRQNSTVSNGIVKNYQIYYKNAKLSSLNHSREGKSLGDLNDWGLWHSVFMFARYTRVNTSTLLDNLGILPSILNVIQNKLLPLNTNKVVHIAVLFFHHFSASWLTVTHLVSHHEHYFGHIKMVLSTSFSSFYRS